MIKKIRWRKKINREKEKNVKGIKDIASGIKFMLFFISFLRFRMQNLFESEKKDENCLGNYD
jgi:hypothetical protein